MNWRQTIERIFEEEIREQHLLGGNVLVYHKGREVFYHQAGLADREAKRRVERDTIYRIFSMTKPVTAAAVMILVDRGQLDLLDPVSKFLPEFERVQVYENGALRKADKEITIKHLLQMTSGLVYPDAPGICGESVQAVYDEAEAFRGTDKSLTTRQMARRFAETPLYFEPGTDWYYGVSADVLGAVIEEISQKRFGTFLQENIFDVLGMEDTAFYVPAEKYKRLAKVYRFADRQDPEPYFSNYLAVSIDMDEPPAFESGGAGLVSTIDDYGKFARMLLGNGMLEGKRILSEAAVQMMHSAGLTERARSFFTSYPFNEGFTYGFLMRNMLAPAESHQYGTVGEYGWEGWLGSYFFVSPKDELTMIFMTQAHDGGYLPCTRRMRNAMLSELPALS